MRWWFALKEQDYGWFLHLFFLYFLNFPWWTDLIFWIKKKNWPGNVNRFNLNIQTNEKDGEQHHSHWPSFPLFCSEFRRLWGYTCPLTNPYTELSFHVYKWQSLHLALAPRGVGGKGGWELAGASPSPQALSCHWVSSGISRMRPQGFSSPGFPKQKMQFFVWTVLWWIVDITILKLYLN